MEEISELAIREGCYNLSPSCPDPLVWLVVGVIVGLWAASSIWLAYIRRLKYPVEIKGDEE